MSHLVLRDVTLIDGTGADPKPNTTIVIRDKKIEAIGPSGTVAYPEDSTVYDGGGHYALPGLIDSHVHITMPGAPDPSASLKEMHSFVIIRATGLVRSLLNAGITTVRNGGSPIYADMAMRQAIEAGLIPGPRIRACGDGLKMTGGHGDPVYAPHVHLDQPGLADGPEACRKVARTNIKMGANHIKIISASGGVMTEGSEPGAAQYTVEEMQAAIDEAHRFGKRTMAHAHGTRAIKNAVLAGIDSIEHGSYLDDEAIEMMLKRGVFLVPTLLATHRIVEHGEKGGIPASIVAKAKQVRDDALTSFHRAVQAGVKIAMGTDAGMPYNFHGENLNELPLMVKGGMTPMQAIVASTCMGAELLDLQHQIGTLVPGKLADVAIVDDNPLTNIDLFKDRAHIVCVIKEGAVFRSDLKLA